MNYDTIKNLNFGLFTNPMRKYYKISFKFRAMIVLLIFIYAIYVVVYRFMPVIIILNVFSLLFLSILFIDLAQTPTKFSASLQLSSYIILTIINIIMIASILINLRTFGYIIVIIWLGIIGFLSLDNTLSCIDNPDN